MKRNMPPLPERDSYRFVAEKESDKERVAFVASKVTARYNAWILDGQRVQDAKSVREYLIWGLVQIKEYADAEDEDFKRAKSFFYGKKIEPFFGPKTRASIEEAIAHVEETYEKVASLPLKRYLCRFHRAVIAKIEYALNASDVMTRYASTCTSKYWPDEVDELDDEVFAEDIRYLLDKADTMNDDTVGFIVEDSIAHAIVKDIVGNRMKFNEHVAIKKGGVIYEKLEQALEELGATREGG